MCWHLGVALRDQDRAEESLEEFTQALRILTGAFNEHHTMVANIRMERTKLLMIMKRFAESEAELLGLHALVASIQPVQTNRVQWCRDKLVKLYETWDAAEPGRGHLAKAQPWREGGAGGSS
ncbi:MAG: hypothetical protein NTV94_11310 [Planctomycetota bacterium]|nr:hypothetical protein [Planctomycetota bacterium]